MVVDHQGSKKTKQIFIRPDSPFAVIYNLKRAGGKPSKRDLNKIPF